MRKRLEALAAIDKTGDQMHAHRAEIEALVIEAREHGATWKHIAEALGTTPSNAHRKYAAAARQARKPK